MSAANETSNWISEQKGRVSTYKPKQPDMPNDRRCAAGDELCKSKVPPHPPGTLNEPFASLELPVSYEWLVVVGVASVAFLLLTSLRP
jgi:hypothetical protein